MAKEEIILVVKKEALFEGETFQGALFDEEKVKGYIENISENYETMRRGAVDETETPLAECAERNTEFKQPIPYIIVTKGDKFYATERLEGVGEARLRGKVSMGIGGHMNPIEELDAFAALLSENTVRELNEELFVEDAGQPLEIAMGGLLNDDSNEVGQVHIGLLGKIVLSEEQDVEIREVEQLKGTWYTLEELLSPEIFPRIESWGQIVVQAIGEGKI